MSHAVAVTSRPVGPHAIELWFDRAGSGMTRGEVVAAWSDDRPFRAAFTAALAAAPYPAFFWETPPLSPAAMHRPFSCVVASAPVLDGITADPAPFAHQLTADASDGVVEFANLGGDAWLLAPTPRAPHHVYPHLAAFVRGAPADQIDALWARVGNAARSRIVDTSWLSTSGAGVAWLHVRIDARPKYYTHAAYRDPAS